MQFWQLSRNFFDKGPKTYRWMSQNDGKKFFFQKMSLLVSIPMYTKMQFWRARRNIFRQKAPNFSLDVQKKMKNIIFSKTNYFHSKCPLDAWGWVLTTPPKISTKRRKNFVQRLERMIFFRKRISSKFSPWHLELNFDNSAQTYWDERRKTYRWFTKKRLEGFFSKNCSSKCSCGQVERCFDNPNYFFWEKPKTCRSMSESDEFFFQNLAFLHTFVLTARIQFWRLGRKNFRHKATIFSLDAGNVYTLYI